MADDTKSKTQLLDELEKGPWPSFVKEIKKTSATNPVCEDLLGQLELSYEEKKGTGSTAVWSGFWDTEEVSSDVTVTYRRNSPRLRISTLCVSISLPAGFTLATPCVRFATFGSGTAPESQTCTGPRATLCFWAPRRTS
jgi:hypothetical protein